MIKKIFYNSSLPRSGSTLIQNILGQNPEIHTTPTSGLFEMLTSLRVFYTDGQDFKSQDAKLMEAGFKGLLKGAIYGFHQPLTNKPYVIDKSRGWGMEYEFINQYDPNPKIICMIRDLRAVFCSLEKKYRNNPLTENHIANWQQLTGTTTEKRIGVWSNNAPIGASVDRLYQVLIQGLHKNILFIKFEDLCKQPDTELAKIYEYLGLKQFKHDFNNIKQITHEDDKQFGIFGDHKIRQKLAPVKEDWEEILGANGCKMITDGYQWFYNDFGYKI